MTMEQKTNNFECYDITVLFTEFYSVSNGGESLDLESSRLLQNALSVENYNTKND